MLLKGNELHVSLYEAKKTMSALGLSISKFMLVQMIVYSIERSMKAFLIVLHAVNLGGRKEMVVLLLIGRGFLQKCYGNSLIYLDLGFCFSSHKLPKT